MAPRRARAAFCDDLPECCAARGESRTARSEDRTARGERRAAQTGPWIARAEPPNRTKTLVRCPSAARLVSCDNKLPQNNFVRHFHPDKMGQPVFPIAFSLVDHHIKIKALISVGIEAANYHTKMICGSFLPHETDLVAPTHRIAHFVRHPRTLKRPARAPTRRTARFVWQPRAPTRPALTPAARP